MSNLNHELSRIFKDLSSIYNYFGKEERFRALSYAKAARVIGGLKEDIGFYFNKGKAIKIPGIGEGISEKIKEYLRTGKIKKYEKLKKQVPYALLELMNVSGVGPALLRQLYEDQKIKNLKQLVHVIKSGSSKKLRGLGEKKIENIRRALKLHKQVEKRLGLWEAIQISQSILSQLKINKEIQKIEIAGSIRRRKETIGDIDLVISCALKDRAKVMRKFLLIEGVKRVLVKGETRASLILKFSNLQVDLRIVNDREWGAALLYFTGSREHTIFLRTQAGQRGYKLNEYGLYRVKDQKRVAGETEESIYRKLGFDFILPEMREMNGECELARKNILPRLIELDDICGDMQLHSSASDGLETLETIAGYVLKNYSYQYIVITDHSKSTGIANGLDEKQLIKQMKRIDAINRKLGRPFLKKGIEVDILPDGKLDLPDRILAALDWVCASCHSGLQNDISDRYIAACNNPYVNCIGHPTGRLLGKREMCSGAWHKIFNAAAKTGTAFEINAQPQRMDLNDELTWQARESGVMLCISTDSHSLNDFNYMQLGVAIARRAWCTSENILNTRNWNQVKSFVKAKRLKFKVSG